MIKDYSIDINEEELVQSFKKPPRTMFHTLKGTIDEWHERFKTKTYPKHGGRINDQPLRGYHYNDRSLRFSFRKHEQNSDYSNLASLVYYENKKELKQMNVGYRDVIIIVNLIFKAIFIYTYNKGKAVLGKNLGMFVCTKFENQIVSNNEDVATHFKMNYYNNFKHESFILAKVYEIYPRYSGIILATKAIVKQFKEYYESP